MRSKYVNVISVLLVLTALFAGAAGFGHIGPDARAAGPQEAPPFRDHLGNETSVKACSCGCGGTPRPFCAHRDCVCAKTGAATVEAARKLTAGCACGCGGTPIPACAHRNCKCASQSIAPPVLKTLPVNPHLATCSCGCGGTAIPACAHRSCGCSSAALTPQMLEGIWEAQTARNHYRMRVMWDDREKMLKGYLIQQGEQSREVGFKPNELVWTAAPGREPGVLIEKQAWRWGANGISTRAEWRNAQFHLRDSTLDTLVTGTTTFKRVKTDAPGGKGGVIPPHR